MSIRSTAVSIHGMTVCGPARIGRLRNGLRFRGFNGLGCHVSLFLSLLLPPLILIVGAGVFFDLVVFDVPYFVGNLRNEIPVVGNHNVRAFVLVQCLNQDIYRLHIEVVGRLIEQQEIGLRQQHFGQCHPRFLPPRQHLDFLENVVAREQKATQYAPQFTIRLAGVRLFEFVQHRVVHPERLKLVLGVEAKRNVVAQLPLPVYGFGAGDDAQQR